MASYHVKADIGRVSREVRAFAVDEHLGDLAEQQGDDGSVHLDTQGSRWARQRLSWTLRPDAGGTFVLMHVRLSLLHLAIAYGALLSMAGAAGFLASVTMLGGLDVLRPEPVVGTACYLVLGLLAMHWSGFRAASRAAAACERRFGSYLMLCSPRILEPIKTEHVHSFVYVALVISLALLNIGVWRLSPMLGVLLLGGLLCLSTRMLAELMGNRCAETSWRVALSEWIAARQSLLTQTFITFGAFLAIGAVPLMVGRQIPHPELSSAFLDAMAGRGWPETASPLRASAAEFSRAVAASPLGRDEATRLLQIVKAVVLAGVAALYFWSCYGIIGWARRWASIHPGETPGLAPPPGAHNYPQAGSSGQKFLATSLVAAGIPNVLHLLLTAEVLSVLIADTSVLGGGFGMAAGFVLLDFTAASHGRVGLSAAGVVFVLMLGMPSITFVLALIRMAFERARKARRAKPSPELQSMVDDLSVQMRIPPPKARIVPGSWVGVVFPWIGRRPVLLVGDDVRSDWNQDELNAAIAHELSHVRFDFAVTRWTRWLSTLCLFPCNVFSLLVDWEQREIRADKAAATVTGKPKAMSAAIAKMFAATTIHAAPITGGIRRWIGKLRSRLAGKPLAILVSLIHPETLLGYTHPDVRMRIATLTEQQQHAASAESIPKAVGQAL